MSSVGNIMSIDTNEVPQEVSYAPGTDSGVQSERCIEGTRERTAGNWLQSGVQRPALNHLRFPQAASMRTAAVAFASAAAAGSRSICAEAAAPS